VFYQVLVNHEYEFSPEKQPLTIIDAGANVGLSAIYFALRFPAARIIAVESEHSNFQLLCENVRPFDAIVPVHAALWSHDGELSVTDPGLGPLGYRVAAGERGIGSVRAVCMDRLMLDHGIDHLDILKIDIEGAEREVFQSPGRWIERVGTIAAELHDRYRPGCSRTFFRATESFDWEWVKGENVFVARSDVFPSARPPLCSAVGRDGCASG
jgi:FkbM family methyltransferase